MKYGKHDGKNSVLKTVLTTRTQDSAWFRAPSNRITTGQASTNCQNEDFQRTPARVYGMGQTVKHTVFLKRNSKEELKKLVI